MPPATALSESDLAAFRSWVACGMPGEELPPAPPAACAEAALAAGDLRVSTADPGFCDQFNGVDGDLVIDAAGPLLDCLCHVTGDVLVEGYAGDALALPVLTRADSMRVSDVALRRLDAPALAALDGDLLLTDLPEVESVELPVLVTVGGGVLVQSSPALQDLGLHRLAEVGQDLRLVEVQGLSWLRPLDALLDVGGDLELSRIGPTEAQPFRRLAHIGGSLIFSDNLELTRLEGFDLVTEIEQDLVLVRHPVLAEIDLLATLERVGGDIWLVDNPVLPDPQLQDLVDGISDFSGTIHLDGTFP